MALFPFSQSAPGDATPHATVASSECPAPSGHRRAVSVQAMFNRIADTYDVLNDCISLGLHRLWKKSAVAQLHLLPGDHVLDVCTGTGDFARYILPFVGKNGRFTGIDFSEKMLTLARQRFKNNPQIHFEQGDAMALPYADNTFDGALIGFGLRNVDHIQQVIGEMVRVVKPGGWIVNLDTNPKPVLPGFWEGFSFIIPVIGKLFSADSDAYRYLCESTRQFLTPKELGRCFQEAGLTQVSIKTFSLGSVSLQAGQKPDDAPDNAYAKKPF